MLRIVVHPANVQDRDGAAQVLDKRTRRRFPFIEVVFADQGYQGPAAATAVAKTGKWTLQIVRRDPGTKGFAEWPASLFERPSMVQGPRKTSSHSQ